MFFYLSVVQHTWFEVSFMSGAQMLHLHTRLWESVSMFYPWWALVLVMRYLNSSNNWMLKGFSDLRRQKQGLERQVFFVKEGEVTDVETWSTLLRDELIENHLYNPLSVSWRTPSLTIIKNTLSKLQHTSEWEPVVLCVTIFSSIYFNAKQLVKCGRLQGFSISAGTETWSRCTGRWEITTGLTSLSNLSLTHTHTSVTL